MIYKSHDYTCLPFLNSKSLGEINAKNCENIPLDRVHIGAEKGSKHLESVEN
jgi:hypothetical protein